MGRECNSVHRKAIDYLSVHPELFGIEKKQLFSSSPEQNIFHRGRTYGKIDLVYHLLKPLYISSENTEINIVIVEYKSRELKSLRLKGKQQLERAVNHYRDFGVNAIGFLVEGELPLVHNGNGNGHREKKYCITRINPIPRFKKE